jgi:hypothetical protein
MSMEHRGFVGLFREKLDRERIGELVSLWLDRFGAVEQAAGDSYQVSTLRIDSVADVIWETNLQFRVLCGEQFAWIYITLGGRVAETSGLSFQAGALLCRDVLEDLPNCEEIIDEHNDRRLDQLEAQGLM